jgi:hypothetical protein
VINLTDFGKFYNWLAHVGNAKKWYGSSGEAVSIKVAGDAETGRIFSVCRRVRDVAEQRIKKIPTGEWGMASLV